jgi:hypothetical protein
MNQRFALKIITLLLLVILAPYSFIHLAIIYKRLFGRTSGLTRFVGT